MFFLVAAVHMRHAEFEECMAHEAFVKEIQKAYNEVQSKTFDFQDFREKKPRPTADEVIDQAVGKKKESQGAMISAIADHLDFCHD